MRRFGLLGKTLTHSFSQAYFTGKFAEQNLPHCIYEKFELPSIEELPKLLSSYPDLEGLNVTIPYKQDVLPFLKEQNDVVRQTGACNCIKIRDGKLYGYNTDVVGFSISLQPLLKPWHTKALVLGTGGASKAVEYVLQQLSIDYHLVSRTKGEGLLTYEELDKDMIRERLLIINTTPLGTFPNVDECPALPYHLLTPRHLLYDLVYNPEKTKFLQQGEAQGAQIKNGYQMLVEQAEESWRIWNSDLLS